MNILEGILCYGGIVGFLLGIILTKIFAKLGKSPNLVYSTAILLVGGGLICCLIGNTIYNNNTLECETVDIVITIQDKQEYKRLTGKMGNVRRHHYFFCFNDTEKIEVDASTYKKFNKGDTLVIKKTYCYRIDRETGERTLEKVTYNE